MERENIAPPKLKNEWLSPRLEDAKNLGALYMIVFYDLHENEYRSEFIFKKEILPGRVEEYKNFDSTKLFAVYDVKTGQLMPNYA